MTLKWIVVIKTEKYPKINTFGSEVEIWDELKLPENVRNQFVGNRILNIASYPADDGYAYGVSL